ncbi:MAG: hypothetical protein KAS17_03075, partial [Victivallaceae bacterium]|nr:hypothetical protein [Victivallaceae bacterium]
MFELLFRNKTKLILFTVVSFMLAVPFMANAGWIEDKDGKTIIHVKAWSLPDAKNTATHQVADYAVLKSFTAKFPEIFKKRYA